METKKLRTTAILLITTALICFCTTDDNLIETNDDQNVTMQGRKKLNPNDDPLIALAYDDTYFYPKDFYVDPKQEGSLYYLNSFYLKPKDPPIELSTNNRIEAFEWKEQFILNMNNAGISSQVAGEERETERYFEFPQIYTTNHNITYVILYRAHKASYFKPYTYIYEIARSRENGEVAKIGYYYGSLDEQKVKEFIEYSWLTNTGVGGFFHKVVSAQFKDKGDYFEEHIYSFILIGGDWGMTDMIMVYDTYVRVDKSSRLVSLQQSLQRQII